MSFIIKLPFLILVSIPPSIKKSSRRMTESSFDKPEIPSTSQIAMKIGDTLKTDAGRDIMIDCEANGIPKPRIIWTKDNEDLASSGRVKIFQNGSLLLKSVTEEESGDFTCTVINNRGVDMYTSKIKILGMIVFPPFSKFLLPSEIIFKKFKCRFE